VYQDVWAALHLPVNSAGELGELSGNVTTGAQHHLFVPRDGGLCLGRAECVAAQSEVMKFVGKGTKAVPIWLAVTYLSSNVVLNSLNFYWFGKMIETVRKRFEKKPEDSDAGRDEKVENSQANGNGEEKRNRGSVKRRRSSIVLEVADGLTRDEMLPITMDRAAEVDGQPIGNMLNLTAEQKEAEEDRVEAKAKTTALENNTSATAANANATATRHHPATARRR
jgi:hypothetical protein